MTTMQTDTESPNLDAAVAAAPASPEEDQRKREAEAADVEKWMKKIRQARKYDEPARKQYAKDRRYARGDSGYAVDSNIVGTNIDILESFLYAKDPDVDTQPARAVQPPSLDAIRDAAEAELEAMGGRSPEMQQAGAQAAAVAVAQGMSPEEAVMHGQMIEAQVYDQQVEERFEAMQKRYARRLRDAKAYGETIELVVSRLWRDAMLKARGRPFVRSGLTIGLGVLKASWQERTAPSPETVAAINDLQQNVRRAAAQRAALDDASGAELDAQIAEYRRQLEALKGQAERVVQRAFVIDQVQGEDFQIPPGYAIANHLEAPWNAHRIPMLKDDAQAAFNLSAEVIKQATVYNARKPVMIGDRSANEVAQAEGAIEAKDADAFTSDLTDDGNETGEWVMCWEIWDRDTGHVLTALEGVKRWVKPAWQPDATTRFYPFFLYTTSEVDGQRHPQSLTTRVSKLVDQYNQIGSDEATHRRRAIPKILFLKGQVDAATMTRINAGERGEYVGVETTQPNAELSRLFYALQYPALDPALYDRNRIIAEIERVFGVQEALAGSVSVAKTATEAEIQQGGFQARTGGRRDMLEGAFLQLAIYTAEVARAHLTAEEVQEIAGPDALWPLYEGPEDLGRMVRIDIRAGSSGKPNTSAEREAWAQQLPMLQAAIMQIGQLRNSNPRDIADCLEKLLQITAERSGDRIDVDGLTPKPGPPPAPMPIAAPGQPQMDEPGADPAMQQDPSQLPA